MLEIKWERSYNASFDRERDYFKSLRFDEHEREIWYENLSYSNLPLPSSMVLINENFVGFVLVLIWAFALGEERKLRKKKEE